ncbi:winged helix-turn-helix domain-containing protein [Inconstantimicrobium mannanitabidum]|uniref:Uncharacterized protein n=1 Tax=Inconstantimicrobium mannanitabidum TaxID=1604901 RepID=A0ACB5R931_9CLOT|nr:winged helix-turn-helix domain-containing protein [Clostridium sp. TW13]GKX65692.1 hypothetical protein rsdtw13_09500 [Clostridium sp. TW13]
MKELNENLSIESSMVYELLASMFRLECHEQLIPSNPEKLKYVSEDITKWVQRSRAKLTEEMKKELNVFFNWESFLGLCLIQLIWENDCYKEIDAFINFLEQYPAKDLIKFFFYTGYGEENMLIQNIEDPIEVKNFLNKASLPEVEKWKLTYFASSSEETKIRFIKLVKDFYNLIFKDNLNMLQEAHAKSIEYMTNKLKKEPYEILQKILGIHLESFNCSTILIPSYYYDIASNVSCYEDKQRVICLYGTLRPELEISEDISPEKIVTAIKILSDENRMKIIKILNTTPCYGYELSQKLGISSSTTSHHVSLLNDIGVIVGIREENKVYYQVNKDKIRHILNQFENMLT